MSDETQKDSPDDRPVDTGYSDGGQRTESLGDAHAGSSPKRDRSAGDDLEGNERSGVEGQESGAGAGDTSGIGESGGRGNTNTGGYGVDEAIRPNPGLKRQ
ncbi:MAG TPA: hypothetical protein VGE01_04270 [Fimbriimonas sp.]